MSEPSAPSSPSKRWLTRGVLGIGLASLFSDWGHEAATSILPAFLASLGAPAAALGVIEGVSDGLSSFAKLAGGFIADRPKWRRPTGIVGYFATAITTFGYAFAHSWPAVLILRGFGWMGRGSRGPSRDTLLADCVTPEQTGRAFGFERAMDTLGAVLGPLCATLLLGTLGARGVMRWTLLARSDGRAGLRITCAAPEEGRGPSRIGSDTDDRFAVRAAPEKLLALSCGSVCSRCRRLCADAVDPAREPDSNAARRRWPGCGHIGRALHVSQSHRRCGIVSRRRAGRSYREARAARTRIHRRRDHLRRVHFRTAHNSDSGGSLRACGHPRRLSAVAREVAGLGAAAARSSGNGLRSSGYGKRHRGFCVQRRGRSAVVAGESLSGIFVRRNICIAGGNPDLFVSRERQRTSL